MWLGAKLLVTPPCKQAYPTTNDKMEKLKVMKWYEVMMSNDMKWGDFILVKGEQINAYLGLLSDSHKIEKRKWLELNP